MLLALAAAVAAAAAKKRQEGPVDARAITGCLATVAVAVAVLLGQGVLEYEYEFLFDAGAMGRFEGLVPQAVPDTVTVQSGNPAPRTSLMAAFALRACPRARCPRARHRRVRLPKN